MFPFVHGPGGELRPVVRRDDPGQPVLHCQALQHRHHPLSRNRGPHLDIGANSAKVIHLRQDPESATAVEAVADKIHRPSLVRCLGCQKNRTKIVGTQELESFAAKLRCKVLGAGRRMRVRRKPGNR
jgi:hypothetical protein